MKKILAAAAILSLISTSAQADGGGPPNDSFTVTTQESTTSKTEKLDPRLPPTLPGETVSRNGKKMRVWSSAGPVPVDNAPAAPEPWQNQNRPPTQQTQIPLGGVILDRREGR